MTHRTIPCLLAASAIAASAVEMPAAALAAGTHFDYGPSVRTVYGPVRVEIRVTGSRITAVWASAPHHYALSVQINRHAVPALVRETLQAQSAAGVHRVSGASLTSAAFKSSLAGAMLAAHLPGA
jgi:uncharacterized protein with FMN-binding domain